jgi:hypothetical protein
VIQTPSAGDVLAPDSNVNVTGIAYDTTATDGSGIDRVSIYLGDRDAGGTFWGNALLGQANPAAGSNSQLANAGYSLRSPSLPKQSGSRSIFAYAHSRVSNSEGVQEVPIFLTAAPTPVRGQVPTPVLPTPVPCTPTPVPTATAVPTTPPTATLPPVVVASPTAAATATAVRTATPATPATVVVAPATPAVPTVGPSPVPAGTTAPSGGGMPAVFGLAILGLGALVAGGGYALRRRESPRD